jgi:hypothetical protein
VFNNQFLAMGLHENRISLCIRIKGDVIDMGVKDTDAVKIRF